MTVGVRIVMPAETVVMSATAEMDVLPVQLSVENVWKNVQIVQKKISVAVVIPALIV